MVDISGLLVLTHTSICCYSDMGIHTFWTCPTPKTLVIWASPSHITVAIWVRVRVTGDAHITRVLGMPKTRGCPYHFDSATLKTRRKLGRVNFRKEFWDCY